MVSYDEAHYDEDDTCPCADHRAMREGRASTATMPVLPFPAPKGLGPRAARAEAVRAPERPGRFAIELQPCCTDPSLTTDSAGVTSCRRCYLVHGQFTWRGR